MPVINHEIACNEVLCPFLIRPTWGDSVRAQHLSGAPFPCWNHHRFASSHCIASPFLFKVWNESPTWRYSAMKVSCRCCTQGFFSQQRTRLPKKNKKKEHIINNKKTTRSWFLGWTNLSNKNNNKLPMLETVSKHKSVKFSHLALDRKVLLAYKAGLSAKNFSKFRAWNSFGMLLIV